jgi:uncharacterized protein (TIGR00369 family)
MSNMTIEELNRICKNSFVDYLGIRFTEFDGNHIRGFMELTADHLQPMGHVHGGVYLSLAETMAGAGSSLIVESEGKIALGASVSSQHIASAKEGKLFATAELIHKGSFKHIWDIEITDDSKKLISISRVTNSIKELNHSMNREG